MAIYDTMRYIKCDVSTICVGMAASMASEMCIRDRDNAPGADTAYASYRLQTACFRAQLAANRERIVQCRCV